MARIAVIAGPTASGKTALAVALAARVVEKLPEDLEIIAAKVPGIVRRLFP